MRRVVNAAGKMTYLGASRLSPGVIRAMAEAGREALEIEAFADQVGSDIARLVGADAARATASAAAGIAIAVAACRSGADEDRAYLVPQEMAGPTRVLIQAGHVVDFGAPIEQVIRLAGARPGVVGSVNRVQPHQLRAALEQGECASVLFVISHHTAQEGMLPLPQVVDIAHERSIPVVVDAAAEEDPRRWLRMGADLYVFSGHKAFSAPTSGFVCGKRGLIEACRLQEKGLGRAMKVGKETLAGLQAALEEWSRLDPTARMEQLEARVERLRQRLGHPNGEIAVSVSHDRTRGIPRLSLRTSPPTALAIQRALRSGDPKIFSRDHGIEAGLVEFDPRELDDADVELIADRVEKLLVTSPG